MNRGYLRRGPGARKRRGERKHVSEYPGGELNFEKPSDEVNDEYPPKDGVNGNEHVPTRRTLTLNFAGETTERRDMSDDLEPADTLIDRDGAGARGDPMAHMPEDARLDVQRVPAGMGARDEADEPPVGEREARRIKRVISKHAHDAQAFEPHEQAEVAARRDASKPGSRHGQH